MSLDGSRRAFLRGVGLAAFGSACAPFASVARAREPTTLNSFKNPPGDFPRLFGNIEERVRTPSSALVHGRYLQLHRGTRLDPTAGRIEAASPFEPPSWIEFLNNIAGARPGKMLREVNGFINARRYVRDGSDIVEDIAPMAEFFERGGDCEEFALVKFISLYRLGFHEERLRLVLCWDRNRKDNHAVLAVLLDGRVHVLDNLSPIIRPQELVFAYAPIASLDSRHLWLHRPEGWKPPPATALVAQRHN